MNEPYRYACPHGDRSIRRVGNSVYSDVEPGFRCLACKKAGRDYKYATVTDLKTGQEIAP